jgi:hypothetical protein
MKKRYLSRGETPKKDKLMIIVVDDLNSFDYPIGIAMSTRGSSLTKYFVFFVADCDERYTEDANKKNLVAAF